MSLVQIVKNAFQYTKVRCIQHQISQIRCGSYKNGKLVEDLKSYTDYEIKYNPEEWKYVERLLPAKWIPDPTIKESYPSGWKPQTANPEKVPYFVERTKNHMIPVYLEIPLVTRGMSRITLVRKVEGDIWKLSEDLVQYLKPLMNYATIGVKVEELNRTISFRGDYVEYIRRFLIGKGF